MEENVVLCAASSYEEKYFFNKDFGRLPEEIKKELQIMCVLFTEEIGGIFMLEFDSYGKLTIKVTADDNDYLFDEIGSELKVRKIQQEKQELFTQLEMFYKVLYAKGE